VTYFMLVFLSYTCLQLYAKLRSQEARMVELARWIAINNPKLPETLEESLPNVLRISDARELFAPKWNDDSSADALPESQPFAKAG
jgi:hypothetical protein